MRPDAAQLSARFASGEDDPVSACERALIGAASAPSVFISLCPDRALAEAEASRRRWRSGRSLGPLDGVPIAWKDIIDVAGTRTTRGSISHHSVQLADHDAAVVERLSAAGTVSIGKTNLSEFAFSGLGLNPHFGTPRHTDREGPGRAPGGSSSGSALAVALGIVPLAIGTDTSGSIRIPAAFNGIAGFKPTQARYDRTGVAPLAPSLDCLGTLASRVSDIITVDRLLSAAEMPVAQVDATLIVPDGVLMDGLESRVLSVFEDAMTRLSSAGWIIERRRIDALEAAATLLYRHGPLVAWEAAQTYRQLLASPDFDRVDRRVRARLIRGSQMVHADVAALYDARASLIDRLRTELGNSLLVTPAVTITPPLLVPLEADDDLFGSLNALALRNTMVLSFLDAPGLALPSRLCFQDPDIGILFTAPAGADQALLSAGLVLEAALRPTAIQLA